MIENKLMDEGKTEVDMANINKDDPSYTAATVRQLPSESDEKERRIRELARETFLTTPWAKEAFSAVDGFQLEYLRDMLSHVDDPDYIHTQSQTGLEHIAELLKAHISEGAENLDKLPKGKPVFLAVNHLGTFKLSKVNPQVDLGSEIPGYDLMYPYLLYAAPLYEVAKKLQDNLYYTGFDFPAQFGKIFDSAGFVPIIPPMEGVEESRTGDLADTMSEKIAEHPNAAIIHFAEGGTTGKRSGKGLYDLEEFKTGIFVIASQLGVPVLPVAQYFNPEKGFELRVFEPIQIEAGMDREGFQKIAEQARQQEQAWLDSKRV